MKTAKHKPSSLSLHSLMVFHEVAKQKGFSQAAKALHISQPAVTKHLKNLELKMGISLINREKRSFTLSDVGKTLFTITKKVSLRLMEVEKLLADLQQEHAGELKVGTTEAYSRCLFPDLLLGFETTYPSVKITLNLGNSEEIEKDLLNYKSDLGLVGINKICPRFECVSLLREDLVLITHPSHPLTKNEVVSLKETIDYPFIVREKGSTTREIILQAFNNLRIYPNTLMEASSSEFIKQWVTREKAISVIAKSTVAEEERNRLIKVTPLSEDLYINVAFVYLKEKETDPVIKIIKTFINYTKNWVAKNKFG